MPLTSSIEIPPAQNADKTHTAGILQIAAGVILAFLLGTGSLISKVWSLIAKSSGNFALVLLLSGAAIGVIFLWRGIANLKMAGRFRKIALIMGSEKNIQLSDLEQKLGWEKKELVRILRRQIARGFWVNPYLDTKNGVFMLEYTPSSFTAGSGSSATAEIFKTANSMLHEMTATVTGISDPVLKEQAQQIIDIATQIYTLVNKSPEKIRQIRQFSNYYLPMTAGLLKNYQELQGEVIKSENIRQAMQKIADTMPTIENVCKKQLNDLYQDRALDISVEIEVLQNMTKEHDSCK